MINPVVVFHMTGVDKNKNTADITQQKKKGEPQQRQEDKRNDAYQYKFRTRLRHSPSLSCHKRLFKYDLTLFMIIYI